MAVVLSQEGQIERLRADNQYLREGCFAERKTFETIVSDQAAEIERLRLQVKMLPEPRSEILARQRAEIERLRGLLRDADDGLDDYWVTTKDGVDWMRRVREALGDG